MKRYIDKAARRAVVFALLAGMAAMAGVAGPVRAEPPVRIVVGFPPGGTTDVIARLVANNLGARLGRTVIVENRAGASGSIAASMVAKAPADGDTLLFAPSSHATNATLYANQPFDTEKDFAAVGLVATTPYVLVVNPKLPVHSVPELVSYLKEHPGKLAYASSSPGTGQHLAGELFKKAAGVDMLHVPYKGSSAALPDLLAGRTPIMFDNIAVMLPHIKSGSLRPLAVTSSKRSQLLPDAPTVVETGLRDYEVLGWFGLFAPAKTSPQVIGTLSTALNAAAEEPAFRKQLAELGAEAVRSTPQKTDTFVRNEIGKWRAVIREAKITLN
jgi:tripartite-type tricarboxylate transporter receptor subunit TctC